MKGTKLYNPPDVPDEPGIYGIITTDATGASITVTVHGVDDNSDAYLLTDEPVATDDQANAIIGAHAAANGVPADKVHVRRRP